VTALRGWIWTLQPWHSVQLGLDCFAWMSSIVGKIWSKAVEVGWVLPPPAEGISLSCLL
jgi:hypothetical protein